MGIPAIKLNLAPPPTLWRLHHNAIAWLVFSIGAIGLGTAVFATVQAYREADKAGQRTVDITERARSAQIQQAKIMDELRDVNVEQEMPRWRLAERILTERALPWSRMTAELERSLVQDVRIKSIQRTRGSDQTVQLKLRGESRSLDAEVAFIESLHKNLAFAQVILETEAEISSARGGIEFNYILQLSTEPPPYELLPKYGPERRAGAPASVPAAAPPAPAPAPVPASVPAAAPQAQTGGAARPNPQTPANSSGTARPTRQRQQRQSSGAR